MPSLDQLKDNSKSTDSISRAYQAVLEEKFNATVAELLKAHSFSETLKELKNLKKASPTRTKMYDAAGVVEVSDSGLIEGSLHTDDGGRILFSGETQQSLESQDPQVIPGNRPASFSHAADPCQQSNDQLLQKLVDAKNESPCSLICMVELTRFDHAQNETLLPLLWQYILDHRNSNDRGELIAVGSAIRKYIAIMPMERMGELEALLESGNKSPLPIELEIEVAKMIYRNFETHPPLDADPLPTLAKRLWELVQAYTNPRILLRDKHAAAASLAIEAIVSMRSSLAGQALQVAMECPYRWFAELVADDLDELHSRWSTKNVDAAAWLTNLRDTILTEV